MPIKRDNRVRRKVLAHRGSNPPGRVHSTRQSSELGEAGRLLEPLVQKGSQGRPERGDAGYSWRSATTGSTRMARRAGI